MLIGLTAFVLACGGGSTAPQASPSVADVQLPTQVVATATMVKSEPAEPATKLAPPTATVELTVAQCLNTFCPPPWLDEKARPVMNEPGIIAASALDELHIYLIYDPSTLSEEEAVRIFETVSGLPVVDDEQ